MADLATNPPLGTRGHVRVWQVHHERLGVCWAYEIQCDDDPLVAKEGGFKRTEREARAVRAVPLAELPAYVPNGDAS